MCQLALLSTDNCMAHPLDKTLIQKKTLQTIKVNHDMGNI